jgi:spoIIIJ-associated protein
VTESTTPQTDRTGEGHDDHDVPDALGGAGEPSDTGVGTAEVTVAEAEREGADPEAIDEEAGLAEAAIAGPQGPDDDAESSTEGPTSGSEDKAPEQGELERLENEGDIAADYLEELLDIADLDGDLDMDVEGDRAAVSIVGGDVRLLVGRDGEVLEALQELTRLAVHRETGERSRLMLDIGGFRADKRSRLEKVAAEAVAEVQQTGQRKALTAMSPFERKVVHDVVAAAGLVSASEGVEPKRYVVVLPA